MPTKAELEAENRRLQRLMDAQKDKQRTWGNEALRLAKEKGYCDDIQTFLDDQGVPYDKPNVTVMVNVTFRIEAVMADAQMEEFTPDFLQSCLRERAFEEFKWSDVHDNDIKEITSVDVDYCEVTKVERETT
jgi:hypothetical protein